MSCKMHMMFYDAVKMCCMLSFQNDARCLKNYDDASETHEAGHVVETPVPEAPFPRKSWQPLNKDTTAIVNILLKNQQ